ncbi:cation:proton antiporter regulatory subunit [Halorubrum sp. DTA98]|uniref:cation:proton antiporter regulatory subunit n=1 Tax=Halorubrum sp. DTA98 TaxID=3402163 RepID=UPI003AAED8B7
MDVKESDLPGVGKKYEIEIGGGRWLVIITHNTGMRELHVKESEDADSEKLLELPDRLARMVGTILEGAYFQPVESDHVETLLTEGTLLEWYAIEEDSPIVGETLESADIGKRTGITVVAIQRDDDVISAPGADETFEAGDTFVIVGDRESCHAFEDVLTGEE